MPRGNQTLAARGWKTLDWGEKGGEIEGAPENAGNLEGIDARLLLKNHINSYCRTYVA